MTRLAPVVAMTVLVCACEFASDIPQTADSDQTDASTSDPPEDTPVELLRLNHLQTKGTHNSYHLAPQVAVVPEWNYTHEPLDKQLANQGVRQLELDVNRNVLSNEFEVFHVLGVDQETTCKRLTDCLLSVKNWSDQNPGHHPVAIMLELKDPFIKAAADDYFDLLEAEILSVFLEQKVVTPDRIQGDYPSLREALLERGWPTIRELSGQVLFWLDDHSEYRTHYTHGDTSLSGRLIFVDSTLDVPYAAVRVLNDPIILKDVIDESVRANLLVRTRLDKVGTTAVELDPNRVSAALASGAHFLSTDVASEFGIPGGLPSRCNPVTAPATCTSAMLEGL